MALGACCNIGRGAAAGAVATAVRGATGEAESAAAGREELAAPAAACWAWSARCSLASGFRDDVRLVAKSVTATAAPTSATAPTLRGTSNERRARMGASGARPLLGGVATGSVECLFCAAGYGRSFGQGSSRCLFGGRGLTRRDARDGQGPATLRTFQPFAGGVVLDLEGLVALRASKADHGGSSHH